ncbi:MAG: PD-(D/E)XK nuclease family protein, partial [Candidatus Methanomethylophilaceae archaeon]|nr:PD-(D/E)XK nuclease family protein [Candidatus Methanomethylophilaceae archaeon]
ERPDVSGYKKRRRKLGVHDIMRLNTGDGQEAGEECDEFPSKGIQYGKDVHDDAESMFRGLPLTRRLPEHAEIRKVLDSTKGADLRYAEMDCGLPLNSLDATLRGKIDLIAIYPDRIDIYDYKTDETDRFEHEYMLQLSVYAHAASGYYGGRPARCHIAYVSLATTADFDPLPLEEIEKRASEVLYSLSDTVR